MRTARTRLRFRLPTDVIEQMATVAESRNMTVKQLVKVMLENEFAQTGPQANAPADPPR